MYLYDLSILWLQPEFSEAGFSIHTNRHAMPEVLEPPMAPTRDVFNFGAPRPGKKSAQTCTSRLT
jgi:hypothetical protein